MTSTNNNYRKERLNALNRDNAILAACKESGKHRSELACQLEDLEGSLGIHYQEFVDFRLWQYSREEIASIIDSLREQTTPSKTQKEYYTGLVMEETGWTLKKARKTIKEARKRTGCSYKEYYIYRMFHMPEDLQDQLYLNRHARAMSEKYDVSRLFLRIVLNKRIANLFFARYMKRNWVLNTKMSENGFNKKFPPGSRIIYKPLKGQGGMGIQVFDLTAENSRKIFEELKQYPEGVIEAFIRQHEDMAALCPTSVNTIRLVSICSSKGKEILFTSVRMSDGTSSVDNFSSGGIAANIDSKTGRICTRGVDRNGQIYQVHPLTGVPFVDFQIPLWDQVIDLVTKAMHEPLVKGFLGWDVAITDKGPVIVEVNTSPGTNTISLPAAVEGKGMLGILEKYL